MAIHPGTVDIFHRKPQISALWWRWKKGQGIRCVVWEPRLTHCHIVMAYWDTSWDTLYCDTPSLSPVFRVLAIHQCAKYFHRLNTQYTRFHGCKPRQSTRLYTLCIHITKANIVNNKATQTTTELRPATESTRHICLSLANLTHTCTCTHSNPTHAHFCVAVQLFTLCTAGLSQFSHSKHRLEIKKYSILPSKRMK